jgi:hypothetical protein
MKPQLALAAATLLAAFSGAAMAHHSFAMFDEAKETKLVGTIKEVQWTNPHIWVQVLVKDAAGKTTEWSIEGGSPNGLTRQGWRRNSIKAGDAVEMTIHPLKNGDNGGSMMKVFIGGKQVGAKPA